MDPISSVGSASVAQASQPVSASGAGTSLVSSSTSMTSITQVGGSGGFAESLASIAGSGQPEDVMKMLVALLLMDALLGNDKDKGKGQELGGMLALSMLAQNGGGTGGITMVESSSTTMVSQQGAVAAYGQTASASSLSIMG